MNFMFILTAIFSVSFREIKISNTGKWNGYNKQNSAYTYIEWTTKWNEQEKRKIITHSIW